MRKKYSIDRHGLALCLFLVFVTVSLYGPVGTFEFDNYDTANYVYENSRVKAGLTAANLRWAFTTTYVSNWHPVTWISHMLDVQLFGLNPGAHHWTNVVLHLANSLLLFGVLRLMTGSLWRSGAVAALFAIHPLHVQSVAWIAERKDLLSTFFGLLAIWRYIRYVQSPNAGRFGSVFLFFILSLMAKPMMVTLPFVLILLDYWPLARMRFASRSEPNQLSQRWAFNSALLLEKIPLLIVSAASCLVTVYAQQTGGAVGSLVAYPFYVRLANALVSYVSYIGKMIWPANLAVFYPHPGAPPVWQVIMAGMLVGGITWVAIRFAKSKPWFIVGWLWYLGTLVPVIGLVQVGAQAMADRYTYLPLIGLFIVLSWGIPHLLSPFRYKKLAQIALAAFVGVILMIISWGQVATWQSGQTLFERALAVTENNYVAQNNLGHYQLQEGRLTDAIHHFKKAVEINPKFEVAHLNMGVALSRQGQTDQAIRWYTRALRLNPDYAMAYNNLGNALYRQGAYRQAIANYLQAIQKDPDYADAYNGIGAALIGLGEIGKAVAFFKKALEINPSYTDAQNNLNNTLAAIKQHHETGEPR